MASEFRLPELGEGVESGYVIKVLVSAGDSIEVEQSVIELETDKATVEVPSPMRGVIKEVHVQADEEITPGQLILTVEEAAEQDAEAAPAEQAAAQPPDKNAPIEAPKEARVEPAEEVTAELPHVPASPAVRKLAREVGVDVSRVQGTGPDGRISIDDVKAHAQQLLQGASPDAQTAAPTPPLPDFERWGAVERRPMSTIKRRTAEHLATAWSQVPHVTQFDRADITELEQSRKHFAQQVEEAGGKLTITAILAKAAASALHAFPQCNSSLDTAHSEIVYKKYCHIGIAVETERGLLVPVIRDVDRKNVVEIAVELTALAERTRNGKVRLEELQGGTFTITNLGGIGGTHFTPIVNFPEVAILGVGRARKEPTFHDDEIKPRVILPLALSYDHRVIDGAEGARFLRWIVEALEEPLKLSLEG